MFLEVSFVSEKMLSKKEKRYFGDEMRLMKKSCGKRISAVSYFQFASVPIAIDFPGSEDSGQPLSGASIPSAKAPVGPIPLSLGLHTGDLSITIEFNDIALEAGLASGVVIERPLV
jgi:hypothetical protein